MLSSVKRACLGTVAGLLIVGLVVGCGAVTPQIVEVTREVPVEKKVVETIVVTQEVPVEKTVIETVVVEKVVTVMPTTAPTPETGPAYGGTLTVTYERDLTSLDTPSAWSTMDWGTAAQLLYNGLYVFNDKMELVPDLAADMPAVSEDGLIYTIPLKQGVLFHNGRELVAADIKYSLERNAKPDSGT